GFEEAKGPPSLARLRGAFTPKRIAEGLAPELARPGERTLASLMAPERRRGESFWGARPARGLAHRILDVMYSRRTHTAHRRDDVPVYAPAARRRARVTSLTETTAGRRAVACLLVAVVLVLGTGLWLDTRATLLWITGPAAA